MKAALLTIRCMLERIGYIDHAFDTDGRYPLVKRLDGLCYRLEAVIQSIAQCHQEDVTALSKEVYGLYDLNVRSSYEEIHGWNSMLDLSVGRIGVALRALKNSWKESMR